MIRLISLPIILGTITIADGGTCRTNTVTLILSDADFGALVTGNANAQRLFMGGKLKIKGNMMKATKIEPVFKKAQSKAKL